jgi:hypothetical protein
VTLRSTAGASLVLAYAATLAVLAVLLGNWRAGPGFGAVVLAGVAFAALAALGALVAPRAGLLAVALAFLGGLPAQASLLFAATHGPGVLLLALPVGEALAVTALWLGGALAWLVGFFLLVATPPDPDDLDRRLLRERVAAEERSTVQFEVVAPPPTQPRLGH